MLGREVISLHVGQAGVQIGTACWELYCLEHGINTDGIITSTTDNNNSTTTNNVITDTTTPTTTQLGLSTYFLETSKGKYVPRSLMVDLESSVVDKVRSGPYSRLFNPDSLITGIEGDASGISSRGHYTIGRGVLDETLDQIHRMVEQCDSLQGVNIFHSLGGGTGSGFTSLLLERLSVQYERTPKVNFCVFPSPRISTCIVEPYNAVVGVHTLLQEASAVIVLDNEVLYELCTNKLQLEHPSYSNLNSIIAQVASSLSAGTRFNGDMGLRELQTNLIPYPRIIFLLSALAPIRPPHRSASENPNISELTNSVFDRDHLMAKCDTRNGKYISVALTYRGDVTMRDVTSSIQRLRAQRDIQFVNWSPCGFKCGIVTQASKVLPRGDIGTTNKGVFMLSNTTAIAEVFAQINSKFDLMYSKRAFVHWYVSEGHDGDGDFCESREDLATLEADYKEILKE